MLVFVWARLMPLPARGSRRASLRKDEGRDFHRLHEHRTRSYDERGNLVDYRNKISIWKNAGFIHLSCLKVL